MFTFVIVKYDTFQKLLIFWKDEVDFTDKEIEYIDGIKEPNSKFLTLKPFKSFKLNNESELNEIVERINLEYECEEKDDCRESFKVYNGLEIDTCKAVVFNEQMLQFWKEKGQIPKLTKLLNGKRFNYTVHRLRVKAALEKGNLIKINNNKYIVYWKRINNTFED